MAPSNVKEEGKEKQTPEPKTPKPRVWSDFLDDNLNLLKKISEGKEPRLLRRVIRNTNRIRRSLTAPVIRQLVQKYFRNPETSSLLAYLDQIDQDDKSDAMAVEKAESVEQEREVLEIQVYIKLLVSIMLIDRHLLKEVLFLVSLKLVTISSGHFAY